MFFFIRLVINFVDFYWILIGWFMKLSVQTFQLLIVIYKRVNFNIGAVHKFVGKCLIPLDPWYYIVFV